MAPSQPRPGVLSVMVLLACTPSATAPSQAPTASPPTATSPSITAQPLPRAVEGDVPMLPQALTSFGAARHGEHLYVYGGYFGRPHEYSEAGQSSRLVRLHLPTGSWEHLGDGPKLQSVALVQHDDALYRVGGMQAHNPAGQPADLRSQDDVARFDPAILRWTELPPLPEPRSSHDAIAVGDTLLVVGGWQLAGQGAPTWLETGARRSLHDDAGSWSRFDVPFRRRAVAAAAAGDRLVVVGGLDPEGKVSQAVDVYDPERDAWTRGPDFPGPGFGVAAVGLGDTVYAGGSDGVVHRWRVGDLAWTCETSMALPRFFHRFVATGPAEIAVLGGIRSMATGTRVRPVERLAVGERPRPPSVLHVQLDNPLPARNRQGVFLLDDVLHVFGGNVSLGQHDFEPQHFTDEAGRLDLATFEWSTMAPYPARRQTMSTLVAADGTALAVGGFGHDGEVARTHPEIHVYDPHADRWTPRPGGLPGLGRTQLGLAEHDGALYILGGLDYDPRRPNDDQFRHERSVLHAPLHDPQAELAPSSLELPRPRRAFASAQLGARVYLVGGMREGFALVEECEVLDLSSRTWHALPGPARPRLSAELVALGDRLYLAGGSSRAEPGGELAADRSIEVFDPATNAWSTLVDALPIETRHMRMLPWRDRLLAYNAHDEHGRVHVLVIVPGDAAAR